MKHWICRLAALLLAAFLLDGCGVMTRGQQEGLALYYPAVLETHRGGDAIDSVTVDWETLPQGDNQIQADAVMALLMGECHEAGFQSPIPAGTQLRSVTVRGGTAWVDLTGGYGQLSGMALTIADYCIALSLTQLEGIYAVHVTVNGQELAYRDNNRFLASDVLLTSMDDVIRTLTAQLYFPDSSGELTAEERLLTQYEGQSAADVVLAALADGPSDDTLHALMPEDFSGFTARVDSGICQLNLSSASVENMDDEAAQQMVLGVVDSLRSLEGVSTVQLYVDGDYAASYE